MAENIEDPPVDEVLELDGAGSRRRRLWRILFWSVAVIIVAGAAYVIVAGSGGDMAVRYVTDKAAKGDLTVTVTATGTIQPVKKVDVSSELSGIVRRVLVDANDRVRVGQVLAELDKDKLRALVDLARATVAAKVAKLNEAEASVVELRARYQRTQLLTERGVASDQTLESARAAYDRANASLASARAEIKVSESDLAINELNLKKADIVSPIDGIVLERNVDPGQTVASSLQAPVLFRLADNLSRMQLEVDIDEADVGKVRNQQDASFTVDAYPNRRFPAKISVVRYASQTVEGVVTYKAILTIDNSDLLLRPGMTATAEIVVERVTGVLLVPNAAIRFSPPATGNRDSRGFLSRLIRRGPPFRQPSRPATNGENSRSVWILANGEPKQISIRVGATDGRRTQVTSGPLSDGQPVIVDAVQTRR